ncbi:MAG TPA: hypothetical protein DCP90_07515 [Clostridiales bacterium]|nr:MAG: hypothetical protein A2Y22_04255 [Clostridiales bacterium GWD2_32_59]HAN10445.1 hypothetical protein [Clostridiales bacterium]
MLKAGKLMEDLQIINKNKRMKSPIVSIIMPTYCRGAVYLSRAIDSVLNQTFKNFEFIIIDDGSKDGTFEILKEYQRKDSRVVIIRHEKNSGLPALRVNEGIIHARGKYICYQFDDDEYLPNFLEVLYNEIKTKDYPCVVYGNCKAEIKSPDGNVVETIFGKEFNYGLLMNYNYIANNSVMHDRSIFDLVGLYDPHILMRRFSDYDLWLRMGKEVPFIWVDKMISRVHAGEKNSLADMIDYNVTKLSNIRKYIEIPRNDFLRYDNISEYDVDDIENKYNHYFRQKEIDYLKRFEITPYITQNSYYLEKNDKYIANLSRPRLRRLLVTKCDFSTSVDVTIKNYTNRIANFPYNYFFLDEGSQSIFTDADYDHDILALYRTIGVNSTKLLEDNKNQGKPVMYIMDDNMFKFHELGEEFSYLKPTAQGYIELEKQVSGSDLVVSYNPIITDDCKKYNKNIIELKTNIPYEYVSTKKNAKSKKIKIGMFSGYVRKNELKEMWELLKKISKKYKKKIEFHLWGMNPKEFGELDCEVYYRPFTHSYDNYLCAVKNSFFHYHICPLNSKKDAALSKSAIKFLEGTVAGAVGIFSNVSPYKNIPDNMCIKVDEGLENWEKTIDKAINLKEEERMKMFNNAKKYIIENYSTEAQVYSFITALETAELYSKMRGKKIAYFFHDAYLGGATLHLLKHALMLRELGFEVLLCTTTIQEQIKDLSQYVQRYNLNVNILKFSRYVELVKPNAQDIEDARGLANWFSWNNVGLVHSVTYNTSVGIACKVNKIPHVATLHQFYKNEVSKDDIRKNKLIDIVHSSSNKYAKMWSDNLLVPARKMCCAIDDNFFSYYDDNVDNVSRSKEKIKILLSGTLQERKNQSNAIKAVALLREKGYNVFLDLIGYDNLLVSYAEECKKIISENRLEEYVNIRGFTENPEDYYANCNILLCSSMDESTPQTILQAMAAGVLVVSTDVGGVLEIIKDNYSGIICKGYDEKSLQEGLEKAINLNNGEKVDMLTNANNTVRMVAKYDFIKSELVNLYNEAFEESKNNPPPNILEEISTS